MKVADVEHIMEEWAPRWVAWERDNVGLQIGERDRTVRSILVCLDVTDKVVSEAIRLRADLIVSHHPLLFRPPKSITSSDRVGSLVLRLAQHKIALYSAHTNLDVAEDGVSFALARALGLQNIRFLSPLRGLLTKIVTFVPEEYASTVMEAMAQAGAGTIGNYSHCSFSSAGRGTFQGSPETNPFQGRAGTLESARETRLEMILPRAKAPAVISALRNNHPYEEVAYDLYPLDNESRNFGMGAVGELPSQQRLGGFLKLAKKNLNAESIRCNGSAGTGIRRVAVCGGSGSELLEEAISIKADAFVTADVRYHAFHDADSRIVLIDAGHWETEHLVLPVIAKRLRSAFSKGRVNIVITKHRTSPIHTY